jgi:ATP-dependent DNA helicase PIF1
MSKCVEHELSGEQERVVELVRQGYNVYFSGDAGTGKSLVLQSIIYELRACYGREFSSSVAVTAATGIAAVPLRGSTLHTAVGCGAPRVNTDFLGMWAPENRARLKDMKVRFHMNAVCPR